MERVTRNGCGFRGRSRTEGILIPRLIWLCDCQFKLGPLEQAIFIRVRSQISRWYLLTNTNDGYGSCSGLERGYHTNAGPTT